MFLPRVTVHNTATTLRQMRESPSPAAEWDLVCFVQTARWQKECRGIIAIVAPASARPNPGTTWSVSYANKQGEIMSLAIGDNEPVPPCFYWASLE